MTAIFGLNTQAHRLILAAAIFYGLGGVWIREVTGTAIELGEVSSFGLGATRAFLAYLVTAFILIPFDFWFQGRRFKLSQIKFSSPRVWASALNRAVNTLAFPTAIVFSTISSGYLMCNITAVGMLIWRLLLKRKQPPELWEYATAAVVLVSAIAYTGLEDHNITWLSFAAGMVGMMSFSGFFFFNSQVVEVDGRDCIPGTIMLAHLVTIPLAALAIFVCWLLSPDVGVDASWARLWLPLKWPEWWAIGYLVLIGVVTGALADWLMGKGQQKGPDLMFVAFVPTLIMLWASFLGTRIGERMISPETAVPFVVAHLAILYGAIRGVRKQQEKS